MKRIKKYVAVVLMFIMTVLLMESSKVQAGTMCLTSPQSITYGWNVNSGYVTFMAGNNWVATASTTAIHFTGSNPYSVTGYGSSMVSFTMDNNTSSASYTAQITIQNIDQGGYGERLIVNVTKSGLDSSQAIVLSPSCGGTYDHTARTLNQTFTSIGDWTISNDSSFITCSRTSGTGTSSSQSIQFYLAKNTSTSSRKGTITLTSSRYNCSKVIEIIQNGVPDFEGATGGDFSIRLFSALPYYTITFTAYVPWHMVGTNVSFDKSSGDPGTYTVRIYLDGYPNLSQYSVFYYSLKGGSTSINYSYTIIP